MITRDLDSAQVLDFMLDIISAAQLIDVCVDSNDHTRFVYQNTITSVKN